MEFITEKILRMFIFVALFPHLINAENIFTSLSSFLCLYLIAMHVSLISFHACLTV